MNGKTVLYLDQWGTCYWARTIADLRAQIGMGGSRVSKMYIYKKDGSVAHVGYVVGRHWLTAHRPVEVVL